MVSAALRQAFIQPDRASAMSPPAPPEWPKGPAFIGDSVVDVLAYTDFPFKLRGNIHSTDALDKARAGTTCLLFRWLHADSALARLRLQRRCFRYRSHPAFKG